MTIEMIIDKAIKELWIKDIPEDYNAMRLLKEDSLKNSFYYHLRRRLGDGFLDYHNLQIYTEFNEGKLHGTGKRADLAIVQLKDNEVEEEGFISDYIERIVAIIELKYKNGQAATDSIYADFEKLRLYMEEDQIDCQYYEGVIHEVFWEEKAWLEQAAIDGWAKGKVTELVASYNENDEMGFEIYSYNGMNEELVK